MRLFDRTATLPRPDRFKSPHGPFLASVGLSSMPDLTRSRDPKSSTESWRIYYGDVQAGTIAKRSGNPSGGDRWQWRCGFYPGSRPGECTCGTAANFDQARAAFERAW